MGYTREDISHIDTTLLDVLAEQDILRNSLGTPIESDMDIHREDALTVLHIESIANVVHEQVILHILELLGSLRAGLHHHREEPIHIRILLQHRPNDIRGSLRKILLRILIVEIVIEDISDGLEHVNGGIAVLVTHGIVL
jgi:hypothetical protein